MPGISDSTVVRRMREYQKALLARDAAVIYQMGIRWQRVEVALEANIHLLAREIAEMGLDVDISTIYKHRRYQTLLAQAQVELTKYNLWAAGYVTENQRKMAVLGIEHASEVLNLTVLEGGSMAFFDRLPVSAVQFMVGNAGKGGPVYTLLQEAYPMAVERMTSILIQNTALGIGPAVTAKEMIGGLAEGLNHALTVARTEQLRVYREASRTQYESSSAVLGYKRFASKSGNTCALCLALDGELYKTSELMSVHPNDRCVMIPVVRGANEITWESGSDWLKKQDAETQQKILGKGAFDMWSKGDIQLMDLVKKTEHATWGPSLKRVPLKDLVTADE